MSWLNYVHYSNKLVKIPVMSVLTTDAANDG